MDAGLIGGGGSTFLIAALDTRDAGKVAGDVLEIGAFTGATTRALAQWASRFNKYVWAIDPFDVTADEEMAAYYAEHLNGRNQKDLYYENTRGLSNIVTVPTRSDDFRIVGRMWCAAFVDGAHDERTVIADMLRTWAALAPGGVMICHDYHHDLPAVTSGIDLAMKLMDNVAETFHVRESVMIGFRRKQ